MALADYALTQVATVQAILGTGFSTARCELAINAVSKDMAQYCGRAWEAGTSIVEFHRGHGQNLLRLKRLAITAVSSVYLWDTQLTVATLDSTITPGQIDLNKVYRTTENDAMGVLQRFGGWPMGLSSWGDLTGQPNYSPEARATNIRVVYNGGYTTGSNVPPDLEQACLYEAVHRLSRPVGGLQSERTPGGWQQSWAAGKGSDGKLSEWTESVLDSYRLDWF